MMKKKTTLVSLNLSVDVDDISDSIIHLEYEQILSVIQAIDLRVADVDFTEQLILMLTKSFKNDLTVEEKERLMVAIRDSMR